MTMTDPDGDVNEMIAVLAAAAVENADGPQALAAGTFIMYPMEDGGIMFVTHVDGGMLAGTKHTRIPPGMIRAVNALASGGSKFDALKALAGLGRKAIER